MLEHDYYTTTEVCRLLDISRTTAIRLSEEGEIPGMYLVGHRYRWEKAAFEGHLKDPKRKRSQRTKRAKRAQRSERTKRTK